jgi:hypothetical protein
MRMGIVNPGEKDPVVKIEDQIEVELTAGFTSPIPKKAIEEDYDVLDDDLSIVDSTFAQKCEHLANKFNADFEVRENDVLFRRRGR